MSSKRYLVVWTYCANYGQLEISADNAVHAAGLVLGYYSANKSFADQATLYVAEVDAVFVHRGPKSY